MGIGLIGYLVALYFPTKLFKKTSPFLMIILILSLLGLIIYGDVYGGTKGWYDLKVITIQPSEIGKIIIILYLAYYYEKHKDDLDNQWTLLKPLLAIIIVFVLITIQPDLGTASVFLAAVFVAVDFAAVVFAVVACFVSFST